MIAASRVLAAPPDRLPQTRPCGRCGGTWTDHHSQFTRLAPCRDCRDVLTDEGQASADWFRSAEDWQALVAKIEADAEAALAGDDDSADE